MKKIAALFSVLLMGTQLSACGSRANVAALSQQQAMMVNQQRAMSQQSMTANNDLSSQSLLGIHKELKRAVEANFAAKDANKDGLIIPAEFPVESPEDFNHFRKLDSNRDGQLKLSEMSTSIIGRAADIMQLKATAAFLFHQLDVDGNKRITSTEITASTIPGVAGNFERYLGKSLITRKPLTYLRKTDFENLIAYALSNPEAAAKSAAEAEAAMSISPVFMGANGPQ